MNLRVGEVLQNGRYRLEAILGQGGFGITYRATHTYLNQTVVIKTLNDALHHDKNFEPLQERFIGEARRLAKFRHPHIVQVSDFFLEAGLPFIVMDYIPGKTLAEVANQTPLPEAQAVHYIRQVGVALEVIHQHGLLHRDVKPQNIILRAGTQSVVLIDFGIAREFTPGLTQTNTGILSAGYAPIEQYLPQHRWTPATDVYALAATLYALLTGQAPVASVLRDRVPLPSLEQFQANLSPAVIQAVLKGMALDPQARPQTVGAWLALLPPSVPLSAPVPAGSVTGTTLPILPIHPAVSAASLPNSMASTSLPPSSNNGTGNSAAVAQPAPLPRRRSLWSALLWSAIIAALIGAGLGLLLRFNQSGEFLPPLPRDESFPPKVPPGKPLQSRPTTTPLEREPEPVVPVEPAPDFPRNDSPVPDEPVAPLAPDTPAPLPSEAPIEPPGPSEPPVDAAPEPAPPSAVDPLPEPSIEPPLDPLPPEPLPAPEASPPLEVPIQSAPEVQPSN